MAQRNVLLPLFRYYFQATPDAHFRHACWPLDTLMPMPPRCFYATLPRRDAARAMPPRRAIAAVYADVTPILMPFAALIAAPLMP